MSDIDRWRLARCGIRKTLRNPLTYCGAVAVGAASLCASHTSWGALVPFVAPLLVQSITRALAEIESYDASKPKEIHDET